MSYKNVHFTHNVARTGLVLYNGSCKNPTNELCITVRGNQFPQLQRKTSHLVLRAVYCVCGLYQPDFFSDVSGSRVSYHRVTLP